MEKWRGTNGFIPARGSGGQMGSRPDAIPNAAGGEGGHGAATPDVPTHTYSDSQFYTAFQIRKVTALRSVLRVHVPLHVVSLNWLPCSA